MVILMNPNLSAITTRNCHIWFLSNRSVTIGVVLDCLINRFMTDILRLLFVSSDTQRAYTFVAVITK